MSSTSDRTGSIASAHPEIEEHAPSRLYDVYRKTFHRHYEINSAADQVAFYGAISSFTPKKPDLILHRGSTDKAPIVAACKFLKSSGDSKMCLGNPEDVNVAQWEDLSRYSRVPRKYRFEMTIPNPQGASHGERRAFAWKRTRNVGVDDAKLRWSSRNFKLVDEHTDQVAAVFTSDWSMSKCGRLQIKTDLGEDFETMVVLSCISIYERARRRDSAAAGGGGGGG
ncbi:hypothetical protein N7492_004884 [Penicillium capsulatum]|uniref:Uncharacterized protein n=1 Tax=Penicillium capsulatum TaxID=69766 RepID=A0A9W9IB71_9EURO|nr:hypothetical protein N7492_004884 [Penicillium capsulatum]KAJ6136008.1 hypothetical protein N7512_001168 [Penicillium capsulatum]